MTRRKSMFPRIPSAAATRYTALFCFLINFYAASTQKRHKVHTKCVLYSSHSGWFMRKLRLSCSFYYYTLLFRRPRATRQQMLRTYRKRAFLSHFLGRTWYTPGANLVSPGADFPPHCVRRAVLDAKTLENGRKWPFPSWRPKPLKSTPLLGIDFRQKPDLAKIYPLCRIAFSTNVHQLGPSILTKFGQNGGLNPPKNPKNGFLADPPRPGGAGTSPTSRQVRQSPTPT